MLFVPVSGARGMGEYARALALARAVAACRPTWQIHFVVSREASYAADTPFPTTLLPSSPTFHSEEVAEVIREFRPTLVVFDNAGRTAQLRAAEQIGARVVYVSSRLRQRRKAFRPEWMRRIDEHWIAYPEFIAGSPNVLERLLLKIFRRMHLRFLDAVLPPTDPELASSTLAALDVQAGQYVLVVPGGGSDYPRAINAPQIVAEAARRIADHGYPTVIIGVTPTPLTDSNGQPLPPPRNLRISPRIPMAALGELIRAARLVVSNGGDTLLQTLACQRPCVAVPIAGDQPHRIERCVAAGLAVEARLDSDDLERVTMALLSDTARCESLTRAIWQSGFRNGMDVALATIERLALPA